MIPKGDNGLGTSAGKLRLFARCFVSRRILAVPSVLALFLVIAICSSLLVTLSLSSPALASQCTLTILSGSAEVQDPGSDAWREAGDGIVLQAGSRVRTGPDSYALLTFFEGSTIKLEPGADVQIARLECASGGGSDIALKQWLGKTWSRVVQMADPGSRYEIQTPSATALVRGTLFETEVDETGVTVVRTVDGLVTVTAQGEEVKVAAGQEVSVQPGAAPSEPSPIRVVDSLLVLTAGKPVYISMTDPTGSSIGHLPNGISFNQISGARSTSPSEGIQVITIPGPLAGEYQVVLRCAADGLSRFIIEGTYAGETIFTHYREFEVAGGTEWVMPVHLEVVNGQLVGVVVGDRVALGNRAPEKVVITRVMEEWLAAVEPADEPGPADAKRDHILALVSGSGGSVSAPGQGIFSYRTGSVVNLAAQPDPGCAFDKWSGSVSDPYSPVTTIVINQAEAVMAHFVCQN